MIVMVTAADAGDVMNVKMMMMTLMMMVMFIIIVITIIMIIIMFIIIFIIIMFIIIFIIMFIIIIRFIIIMFIIILSNMSSSCGALLFHLHFNCAVRPDLRCRGCAVTIVIITAADAGGA